MSDDGILHVVEHIEAELQRLGRLVATLRRRIEASHENEPDAAPASPASAAPMPVSRVVSTGPIARGLGSRPGSQSQRRFPVAIEENDLHDEAAVRTATGSSYGFAREPTSASWKKRTLESEPAHVVHGDDQPLDRKTR